MAAAVQCNKCNAEKKLVRRELDSWRHKLIHCVGFESILKEICGPMLLRDLHLFLGCKPHESADWPAEASLTQCSFCNLPLDKLSDQVPAAASPLSFSSDYSPCQTSTFSEGSQSAHKFLQAVFHNTDASLVCDSRIPLVAQELMKKMIHQFAVEYASKCVHRTTTNGVTSPAPPLSETSDAPLDLTVNRTIEERKREPETDAVLDLSNRNSTSSAATSSNYTPSGSRPPSVAEERGVVVQRWTKFHQCSALDAILCSLCPAHRSLLYQIFKQAHKKKMISFNNHRPIGDVHLQLDTKNHSVILNNCKSNHHKLYCNKKIQDTIATPAEDAGARKKGKSPELDLTFNLRNGMQAKKARLKKEKNFIPTSFPSLDPDEACGRNSEPRVNCVTNLWVNEGTPCTKSAEHDRDKATEEVMCASKCELTISNVRHDSDLLNTCEIQDLKGDHVQTQTALITPTSTACTKGYLFNHEEPTMAQNYDTFTTPDRDAQIAADEQHKFDSRESRGVRKSMRNIAPPTWFSSYVTWHAPLLHGPSLEADNQTKLDGKTSLYTQEHKEDPTFEPAPKEASEPDKNKCQILKQTVVTEKLIFPKSSPETDTNSNDNPPYGRLRSSTRRLQALEILQQTLNDSGPPSPKVQYVSPIKLMFVYPVKDNEGVKYSLKSAGSSLQTEVAFDPCVESSWAGTPQKQKSQCEKKAISPSKKSLSPEKAVTSRASSTSSPTKSPKFQSSPRYAASSPKSRARTNEVTPSKFLSESENQRSPLELVSFETTPPKRRPGRPRKLGPQLEPKVKKPIGRPRKQKNSDSAPGSKSLIGKCSVTDAEEDVTKNLKITVVYGRSRRNKRLVSEGFDQLQTDFNNASQAEHLSMRSGSIKSCQEECDVSLVKEPSTQSTNSIKTQKPAEAASNRKPGRPAKIKISGISVTVTTASPRWRQIHLNRETWMSPKTKPPENANLSASAKEPCIASSQLPSKSSPAIMETKNKNKYKLPNQAIALRQSERQRKPSIHFLHAVANSTSRSYKFSNSPLWHPSDIGINKASNNRRQEEQHTSAEPLPLKRQPYKKDGENINKDLSKVAKVSLDSIFSPRETVRWWLASAKEMTVNQELARRIKVISDTWVADAANDQDKEVVHKSNLGTIGNSTTPIKSKKSSVVQTLFDCSPNTPRSFSMQQICSWFMQTTETQSLAIVKKASARNPFEIMHFPRSANKESIRYSPQAERLHNCIKKFPKAVPKSPLQHQQAQLRLKRKKNAHRVRRQLLVSSLAVDKLNQGVMRWKLSAQFRATFFRVKKRFLSRREREKWQMWKSNMIKRKTPSKRPIATMQPNHHKALNRSLENQPSNSLAEFSHTGPVNQTLKHTDDHKEQKLSSKTWSPEKLKECRVFLRNINSPNNELAEEGDSCTVTLENGSTSADLFEKKVKDLEGVSKAVRKEKKWNSNKRTCSEKLSGSEPESSQKGKQRAKHKQSEVASPEVPQPPPAKVLRQSRMRGLTGSKWRDFVFA